MKKTIVIILIIASIITLTAFKPHSKQVTYIKYTVTQEDTLWSICVKYNLHDTRKSVEELKKINNCDCTLYPGQELLIPQYK